MNKQNNVPGGQTRHTYGNHLTFLAQDLGHLFSLITKLDADKVLNSTRCISDFGTYSLPTYVMSTFS